MKKNLFVVAAVALMAIVSCNKEEVNNEVVTPDGGETMEFTAYVGADTKATLVEEGDKDAAYWELDDVIYVNGQQFKVKEGEVAGESVTFEGPKVEAPYKAVFAPNGGTHESVEVVAAVSTEPLRNMVSVAYAEEGESSLEFKNVTSILKFQVPVDCKEVTISSDTDLAGTVSVTGWEDGIPTISAGTEKAITLTITDDFKVGSDYYVAVLPGAKVNFTVRVDGYLSRQAASVNINRSSVINMPLDARKESAKYGIAGTMQPNQWDAADPIAMYEDVNNTVVLKNVELYKDDAFKVVVNKSWDVSYGNGDDNMTVDKNGIFDIEFNTENKTIAVSCIKEFTDLKVKIYVENQKKWSPLNIHCWVEKGDNDIALTEWPGSAMTKESEGLYYYEIDGSYIGNEIGYIINNGSEQTDDLFQKLTKDGFTYILPNEVCRLTVKILKSTYDWYNNYIYSWLDGEEPSGSWPGTKMSWDKEENGYKIYYYDFPAKYDGKTMNFIINNGEGTQTGNLSIQLSKSGSEYKIN